MPEFNPSQDKAGFSEDVIVSTIDASPGNYDTSANALIALKASGLSNKVISAIVVKSAGGSPASVPAAAATAPGGAVVFAIYVLEGAAITEYQLLRHHTHDTSHEFRSMTGGVFHSSCGAERDSLEFHADKVAPRLYQITLDGSMRMGACGLLPPGSYTSSNMASGGKSIRSPLLSRSPPSVDRSSGNGGTKQFRHLFSRALSRDLSDSSQKYRCYPADRYGSRAPR